MLPLHRSIYRPNRHLSSRHHSSEAHSNGESSGRWATNAREMVEVMALEELGNRLPPYWPLVAAQGAAGVELGVGDLRPAHGLRPEELQHLLEARSLFGATWLRAPCPSDL